MIEQIRREIEAAFADVPMPESSKIINDTTDSPGGRALGQVLAGLPRITLDADFLRQWYYLFDYLTPKAYHYYLPAIITCELEPDYVKICATGTDARHEYQTSLFNEEQYKLVCSFAEVWFEKSPFQMASSLVWRWNRYEHPALDKAREFYRKMHNFEYPASSDERINALIRQIRSAFDATPYPDDGIGELLYDPDDAEVEIEFRGVDWRHLHPDFIFKHGCAPTFFKQQAFRYFLPAYVIADLMYWETDPSWVDQSCIEHGWIEASPASRLVSDFAFCWGRNREEIPDQNSEEVQEAVEKATRRFSVFNQQEREAIVSYLRYQLEEDPTDREIESALQNYWLKPTR